MKHILLHLDNISKKTATSSFYNLNVSVYESEFLVFVGLNARERFLLVDILNEKALSQHGKTSKEKDKKDFFDYMHIIDNKTQLVPQMSIAENLVLFSKYPQVSIVSSKKIHKKANEMLEICNITVDVDEAVSTLTRFQHILLCIAKAYFAEVKIFVLQNIVHLCSDRELVELYTIIKTLLKHKRTVIMSENRITDIMIKADRFMIIENSQISRIVYKGEFTKEYVNALLYNKAYNLQPHVHFQERVIKQGEPKWSFNFTTQCQPLEICIDAGKIIGLIDMRNTEETVFFGDFDTPIATVNCAGETFLINNFSQLNKKKISFLPSDINKILFSDLSAIENILLSNYKKICKVPNVISSAFYNYFKKETVLRKDIFNVNEPISNFDTLNKIRILLERFKFEKTELLIMQSPTYIFDGESTKLIYDFVSNFTRDGGSILLIAKNYHSLRINCDDVHILKEHKTE